MTQSKTSSTPAGASEPAQTAGNAPEQKCKFGPDDNCITCGREYTASSQEAAPPLNNKAQRIADYFGVPVAFDAEPTPSPATKETSQNWQLFNRERDRLPEHERENFTADVIDQMDDEHFSKVLTRNAAVYAEQYPVDAETSSSQGPAREETPPTARKSYEKWVREIRHEEDIEEYAPMGWTVWQAAFDAGAKSVVAAPQPYAEDLFQALLAMVGCHEGGVMPLACLAQAREAIEIYKSVRLAGAAALPSPDSPEEEILGRAVWKADREWNDLTRHDKLAPSADWGEWIASHVVGALENLNTTRQQPVNP